jgi:hypothetical protein
VRRTLEPLVAGLGSADILNLRVLDPSMGSGAFLVATCRYLASAVENALIEEGRWHAHDITPSDRAALRRQVASRCLFGVDVNPMAVQLARLSLWLATLAEGKPLSFLDHHLVSGNSLIGATFDDVRGRAGGGRRGTRRRHDSLPLFDDTDLAAALAGAARLLSDVSRQMDDSPDIVRAKERSWRSVTSPESSIGVWKGVLDLWCATWFWENGEPPDRAMFGDLSLRLLNKPCLLPAREADRLLEGAGTIAKRHGFLHWTLTFPEVFGEANGSGQPAPGFDAVIGNPPWDMVRGDSGDGDTRAGRQWQSRRLTAFVRHSGIYRVEGRGHLNLYQLFLERALQLVRRGGRLGFVVPAGLASDTGAAPLRRHLFGRADVDEMTGFDNREAIFPVHRSVRFLLLTCTEGRPTTTVRCRFGLSKTEDCESPTRESLALSRRFLARLSGEDDLGIPEIASAKDLSIVEAVSAAFPHLGSREGWNAAFGRELNATDDRDAFVPLVGPAPRRPVLEGKHVQPFRVAVNRCRFELRPSAAPRLGGRARLAYRDIASAGNRLTLIAAIVPARAVTTHTLFCLKTRLPEIDQRVLCALLNSYVANYLVRFRVNTHVTASLVSRLPVPLVRAGHPAFNRLAALASAVAEGHEAVESMEEHAEIQAAVARLYGLSHAEFEHVLSTFPLVPADTRRAVLERFRRMAGHGEMNGRFAHRGELA